MTETRKSVDAVAYCRAFEVLDASGFSWAERICRALGVDDVDVPDSTPLYYDEATRGVYTEVTKGDRKLTRLLMPNGKVVSISGEYFRPIDDVNSPDMAATFIVGAFGNGGIGVMTDRYPQLASGLRVLYRECKSNLVNCQSGQNASVLKLAAASLSQRADQSYRPSLTPIVVASVKEEPKIEVRPPTPIVINIEQPPPQLPPEPPPPPPPPPPPESKLCFKGGVNLLFFTVDVDWCK